MRVPTLNPLPVHDKIPTINAPILHSQSLHISPHTDIQTGNTDLAAPERGTSVLLHNLIVILDNLLWEMRGGQLDMISDVSQ